VKQTAENEKEALRLTTCGHLRRNKQAVSEYHYSEHIINLPDSHFARKIMVAAYNLQTNPFYSSKLDIYDWKWCKRPYIV